MRGGWSRFAPLTGVIFVVLVVVGFVALGRSTPGVGASVTKIHSFYQPHHDREMASGFVVAIASAFLLFFVAHLRSALGVANPAAVRMRRAAFGGGVVAVGGFLVAASVHVALADGARKSHVTPQALQALNVLDNDMFLPVAGGIAVTVLAAGLVLAGSVTLLPRWLGGVAIFLGIVGFTPAGFFAFLASGIWILVVSVLLFTRWQAVLEADAPGVGGAPPPAYQ
jgi:hypothetical protein